MSALSPDRATYHSKSYYEEIPFLGTGRIPSSHSRDVCRSEERRVGVSTEYKKATANYGASNDEFGSRVAISGDTLPSGAYGKDGDRGAIPSMNFSLQEMDRGMKE